MTTAVILERLADAGSQPRLIAGSAGPTGPAVWTGADLHRDALARVPSSAAPLPAALRDRLRGLADGETPERTVTLEADSPLLVAAPWHEAVVDIVMAAWHAGSCVHVMDEPTPARLLAALQRVQAGHAVLTGEQLTAIEAHPARSLTDLASLRKVFVLHDEGVADGIDRLPVERIAIGLAQPAGDTCPADTLLQAETASATDACLAGLDYARGVDAARALSRAALHAMLYALQRGDVFTTPDVAYEADDVLARVRADRQHHALLRRWLRVLADEGWLTIDTMDTVTYRLAPTAPCLHAEAMQALWNDVEQRWLAAGDSALTIAFARSSAAGLPALIDGSVPAVHMLFPEGRLELAHALDRECLSARYQHHAVAECVRAIARRARAPLRLLEVGGGTAATTDHVWPALQAYDVDYLFTDVSRFFTAAAERRYAGTQGFRTGVYDIDRAPVAQGHATSRFDVIVAGGVLNAARDTHASLRWLVGLLAPGGWLVLSEPTVEEYWVMASQAFMLAEPDDERSGTRATFLSWTQWRDALAGAGLHCAVDLPPEGHPVAALGHRVFAARATGHTVPTP